MPNIQYVCLSDLHLGEEDSLLTDARDCARPSPVLRCLAECLAEILRQQPSRPILVLAGDVLELALGPAEQALTTFEQFLRELMPASGGLFREIVYMPGNHDHHLWQAARDSQYVNHLGRLDPAAPLDAPWDTTKIFLDLACQDRLASGLATAVARRVPHLRDFEILAAYPNFGVRDAAGRAVVFHHGHFIEPAYRMLSTVASLLFPDQGLPADVYTLEKENSAWIDFFWSAMGSCGRIGKDIETIYDASTDEGRLRQLADHLAAGVARNYAFPSWMPRFLREWGLKTTLREVARGSTRKLERQRNGAGAALSAEGREGLRWYVEGPLARQLEQETAPISGSRAFVFGHTHKPYVDCMGATRVLNTGGWVVDARALQSLHGGAAVLVDEELSTVNLRWYNEGAYAPFVEEPLPPGAAHSAFYDRLNGLMRAEQQPWASFAETARAEVELRIGG